MLKRTLFASLAASLALLASPALAQLKAPEGMVWKSDDGTCQIGGGEIEGCSFGPASSQHKTGFAYYRACGQIVEARPFLIADLSNRTYRLYARRDKPPEVWPFRAGTEAPTPQEVASFAAMLETKHACIAV